MKDAFRNYIKEHAHELPAPSAPPVAPVEIPGFPPSPDDQSARKATGEGKTGLPEFKTASEIRPESIKLPGLLIDGLLHRGSKMVLAGGSKSYKSWSLIDLGLSVATGSDWWGCPCRKGRVLYVNFELISGFFEDRLSTVTRAKGTGLPDNFLYWNLRGLCYDLSLLVDVLRARVMASGQIDLLIIDPIYKALGDLDENSAGDMAALMKKIEDISEAIGSAVVFGAHFSKGNQASKEAIDRISGSGVFARDPDVILTMTRHTERGSFVVASDLRYLPHLPDFVVSWDFPLMKIDEGKDPRDLFVPGAKPDRKDVPLASPFTPDEVLALLPEGGLTADAWRTVVIQRLGRAGRDFYEAKGLLLEKGRVKKAGTRFLPVLKLS